MILVDNRLDDSETDETDENMNHNNDGKKEDSGMIEFLMEKSKELNKSNKITELAAQLAFKFKERDDMESREVKDSEEDIQNPLFTWNEDLDALLVAMVLYHGSRRHNLRMIKVK